MRHACTTAALLLLLSGSAVAMKQGDWGLDLNLASRHSEDKYDNGTESYNEQNHGLGIAYGWRDDWDLKAGFFENSYEHTSAYAGAFWHRDFYWGDWTVAPGVGLLLVTGYDNSPQNAPVVAPMLLPAVSFGHRALRANIGWVPFGEVDFFTLQLQLNFSVL